MTFRPGHVKVGPCLVIQSTDLKGPTMIRLYDNCSQRDIPNPLI